MPPDAADPNPPETDAGLARRAAAGDARAFHELVDRHAPSLFRLAVSQLGNLADAEDVLQETLAGAFNGLGKFEGRSSVKTWLSRILITQIALWRRRSSRRRTEAPGPTNAAAGPTINAHTEGVDQRLDLHAALRQLSEEHRTVIGLREFEQLSYDEIAAVLGVPRGTVESRLFRARQELRALLSAYQP